MDKEQFWFVVAFFVSIYVIISNLRTGKIRIAMVNADRFLTPKKFWAFMVIEIIIVIFILTIVMVAKLKI